MCRRSCRRIFFQRTSCLFTEMARNLSQENIIQFRLTFLYLNSGKDSSQYNQTHDSSPGVIASKPRRSPSFILNAVSFAGSDFCDRPSNAACTLHKSSSNSKSDLTSCLQSPPCLPLVRGTPLTIKSLIRKTRIPSFLFIFDIFAKLFQNRSNRPRQRVAGSMMPYIKPLRRWRHLGHHGRTAWLDVIDKRSRRRATVDTRRPHVRLAAITVSCPL